MAKSFVPYCRKNPNKNKQVINNDGNPISLTTTAGEQIKVVMSIEEGTQSIQGLLADGTLVPLNLTMQEGKAVAAELLTPTEKEDRDAKEVEEVDILSIHNKDLPESTVEQLLEENDIQFLTEEGQKLDNNIQFLTEDGQNVCFVTTYIDDSINPQYLAMS